MVFARIRRLSPATKLVLKVLQSNGWMRQDEIVRETLLPARTVKYAIRILREVGGVTEKPDFDDLRRKFYRYNRQGLTL